MKFPFSNSSVDELGPLRELRSPLSVSAIRERVLERAAQPALWWQLRNVLAEFLVVGVACAAVFQLAGPVANHSLPVAQLGLSNATYPSDGTDRAREVRRTSTVGANGIGPFHFIATLRQRTDAISPYTSETLFSDNSLAAMPIALSNNTVISSLVISHPSTFSLHPSSFILQPSPVWFASASGGAIFSQIRMMGERGEIGFEDGWKTIALSYTSGDGSRDLRDEIAHHSGLTAPLLSKEHNQEFSLLFGATVPVGPLELRAMAGPAYLSSSSAYFNPATGTTAAPLSLQGFGAAAEVSALYQWNSSFEIGVNGIANYLPRQFTSGIFASLEYRFGP